MSDTEAFKSRKTVDKKKSLQIVNILKEFVSATTITKHILDLKISLNVGDLFAGAPVMEKQLTKTITENLLIEFRVHNVQSHMIDYMNPHL